MPTTGSGSRPPPTRPAAPSPPTGDLALLEGGREVTISRAALTAGPATWALADDGPVRVRYQNGLVTLPQPVTLVNNGQELSRRGHAWP